MGRLELPFLKKESPITSFKHARAHKLGHAIFLNYFPGAKDLLLKCRNMLSEIAHKFHFPPADNFVYVMQVYEKEIMNNLICDYSMNRRHETNHKKKIFGLVEKKCPNGPKERHLRLKAAFHGKDYSPLDRFKPGQVFLETRTWEF